MLIDERYRKILIMWIEKNEKKYYINSSKLEGIRLFFEDIDSETILKIKSLVKYLRKNYFSQ